MNDANQSTARAGTRHTQWRFPDGSSAKWATLEYPGADAYTISRRWEYRRSAPVGGPTVQVIDDPIDPAPYDVRKALAKLYGPVYLGGSRKQRRLAATKAVQRARRHRRAFRRILAKWASAFANPGGVRRGTFGTVRRPAGARVHHSTTGGV